MSSTEEPQAGAKRRRSARHVQGAVRLLDKEARKIVRKHEGRLGPEATRSIQVSLERLQELGRTEDINALEREAENLDRLLQQHARFARKGAFRETFENIAVAILVALALRSCLYEPFKIPSGSMMPTLRSGDHIFVNKFVYGVQIPFTNTVVGERWGHIERGDVIVFRYPLDESEDFIKRVIGLPGDTIRVQGRRIAIKRAGEEDFEEVQRRPIDEPCYDEGRTRIVPDCQLYEESIDDSTYVVRYRPDFEEGLGVGKARMWVVPDRHLLVMGDNRNESHDSLAWTVSVEAVSAAGLLSTKDLRDLIEGALFTARTAEDEGYVHTDPGYDHITYLADHRSPEHDLQLSVWRQPAFGVDSTFSAAVARVPKASVTDVDELLGQLPNVAPAERARWLSAGADIDAFAVGDAAPYREVVAKLSEEQAVLHLQCGVALCPSSASALERFFAILAGFSGDPQQDARELLAPDVDIQNVVRFAPEWTHRTDPDDYFLHRRFAAAGGSVPDLELWAWRQPPEQIDHLQRAALTFLQGRTGQVQPLDEQRDDAWLVQGETGLGVVLASPERKTLVVMQCTSSRCDTKATMSALADLVRGRLTAAERDRRAFGTLLVQEDVEGMDEVAAAPLVRYGFDRVRLQGNVRGADHRIDLEVWLRPPGGVEALLASLRERHGLAADSSFAPGGASAVTKDSTVLAAPIEANQAAVLLRCSSGVCKEPELARKLFERVLEKARDPSTFIDPEADRAKPFVPRGNVKGRAERIWLPLSRFWLPIR